MRKTRIRLVGLFLLGVVLGAFAMALSSCSRVPAIDPATAAKQARRASVAACNAYDVAVSAGAPEDERANLACAATRGICADVEP
jgi:hypothetical protein